MHEVWKPWPPVHKLFAGLIVWDSEPTEGEGEESRGKKREGEENKKEEGRSNKRRKEGGGEDEEKKEDKRGDEAPLDVEAMTGTLEEYLEKRQFVFIHHYAGREDVLSEAMIKACCDTGLTVKVIGQEWTGTQTLSREESSLLSGALSPPEVAVGSNALNAPCRPPAPVDAML